MSLDIKKKINRVAERTQKLTNQRQSRFESLVLAAARGDELTEGELDEAIDLAGWLQEDFADRVELCQRKNKLLDDVDQRYEALRKSADELAVIRGKHDTYQRELNGYKAKLRRRYGDPQLLEVMERRREQS